MTQSRIIIDAATVGRTESGSAGGMNWTAVYVTHNDGTQGWQITYNQGRMWTPRETLPAFDRTAV